MTSVIAVEDAGWHLKEIIEGLDPSDEVTIVSGGERLSRPGIQNLPAKWMAGMT